VLDFLVTGDASNIDLVKGVLRDGYNATNNDKSSKVKWATKVNQLQSHVDEGMPQQAVCNWVMCEKCTKWHRFPFHVNVDALLEKFYCKYNIWNPESNSCNAPEDLWQDSEKQQLAKWERSLKQNYLWEVRLSWSVIHAHPPLMEGKHASTK